mgnify:CR=1 FL=1
MTERKLILNGLEIHTRIKGDAATAILFIHGSSLSSRIWDAQFTDPQLSRLYRLIAIDLPGHGQSSWAADAALQYSFQGLAHVIKGVIDLLELKKYLLAGLSIGTNVAGEITAPLPGCKGFFLTGPSPAAPHIDLDKIVLPFEYGAVLATPDPADAALENYIRGLVFSRNAALLAELKNGYRHTDPAFRANLGNILASRAWSDEIAQLNKHGLPVALVYGREEQIVNTAYLRHEIPHPWKDEIILVDDAGHLANADQPAVFNRLLLDFAASAG